MPHAACWGHCINANRGTVCPAQPRPAELEQAGCLVVMCQSRALHLPPHIASWEARLDWPRRPVAKMTSRLAARRDVVANRVQQYP